MMLKNKSKKVKLKHFFQHETKILLKHKFITTLIILISYFIFASWHFGLKDGFLIMLLTWSFFVLATPIPDGGIILDLPIRFFTGIKMIFSEIFVWSFAITINILTLKFNITAYDKTVLLTIFKTILVNPFPYGIIIILSCAGTFSSLYFGDELFEVVSHIKRFKYQKHKTKFKFFMTISIIIFILIIYEILLNKLGIKF